MLASSASAGNWRIDWLGRGGGGGGGGGGAGGRGNEVESLSEGRLASWTTGGLDSAEDAYRITHFVSK